MSAPEKGFSSIRHHISPSALNQLMAAVHLRDPATARHSAQVAKYSRAIAEEVGMPREDCELAHLSGLMHDVGKLFLPDHILKGTGRLSEADYAEVRQHPERGAWLIAEVSHPGALAEIVLDHHERIDGNGYPNGITGDEISEYARIISVADVYDVMTSRDSYRIPVSTAAAIGELRRVAGTQLDARFVEALITVVEREKGRHRWFGREGRPSL